jgi:hypothetical protein
MQTVIKTRRYHQGVTPERFAELSGRSDADDIIFGPIRRARAEAPPAIYKKRKIRIGDSTFETARQAADALRCNYHTLKLALQRGEYLLTVRIPIGWEAA